MRLSRVKFAWHDFIGVCVCVCVCGGVISIELCITKFVKDFSTKIASKKLHVICDGAKAMSGPSPGSGS